jgi:DNA repair exonuclease SbcCD ATPase subunit
MIDPDCVASTEVCLQRAEKRETLMRHCAADPEWCKDYRAKKQQAYEEAQALNKQCRDHPEQCAELRQQFNQKQAQQRKAERQKLDNAQMQWCLDNQAACEQWKIDLKQIQQKCQELQHQLEEKYPTRPH